MKKVQLAGMFDELRAFNCEEVDYSEFYLKSRKLFGNTQIPPEAAVDFVQWLREVRQCRHIRYVDFEIVRWLYEQPSFTRARRLALYKSGVPSQDPDWESMTVKLIDCTHPVLANMLQRQYFLSALDFNSTWEGRLLNSLDRYLNSDHEALYVARARVQKSREIILRELRVIEKLFAHEDGRPSRAVTDMQLKFDQLTAGAFGKPARNSMHKAEHSFVLDMWKANMSLINTSKPAVIAELMHLCIFHHQFDLRHIARICSGFRDAMKVERIRTAAMVKKQEERIVSAMTKSLAMMPEWPLM
ncbi:MAG: hypothetical protein EON54_07905 [Alcaligenaceae bacterium]|nr:MAG: hypothetical protein EON54_07905 [Alcaligenaceae bacterium]